LPGEFLRVEKAVINLVEFFAGDVELAKISAPPYRDDRLPGRDCGVIVFVEEQLLPLPFNPFDSRPGHFNSGRPPLRFHFLEKRFLHIGRKLEAAVQLHFRRIGVDRFGFRKINDRRKNLRGLKDREVQPRLLRLDRSRNPRDPRADNREIENSAFLLLPSSFFL
jgi:hypothetical protein